MQWIPGRNEKSALDHDDDERDHSEGDHQELLALHDGVTREVDEHKGFHSKLEGLSEVGYGQETALDHDVGEGGYLYPRSSSRLHTLAWRSK